ncbi:MAG: bifunctional aspartate kinase/homoserine dehydrogenase I [Planctomycetota bacterium]|jgi:aspartokinase/homoserine dehydrogenase 1
MASSSWQVHKFGGTCLADSERIATAARLATDSVAGEGNVAVVVSAMAGVTDALIEAADLAASQNAGYLAAVQVLQERTVDVCTQLLLADAEPVTKEIVSDFGALRDILRGVFRAGVCPETTRELISGFGEAWSAATLHGFLVQQGHRARWLNAQDVLVVEHDETGPAVAWEDTQARFNRWLKDNRVTFVVITGYVARDPSGAPTTLRRNGSDFSAAIFARLLNAQSLTIWTDVDGVMSADPRRVPEATVLPQLSYDEAMELAYFGAAVLHPQTMGPVIESGIPVHIRNALAPDAPGTTIGPRAAAEPGLRLPRSAVKGFSSVEGIALVNLEGAGMVGVPGVASRMFAALREAGVSVVMISQGSSEHSICVAIPAAQQEAARGVVERMFAAELMHGQVQRVEVSGPYGILAAVGDDMVETPGVAARFFGALGRAGINVRAVAQGSSERNLSVVVTEADTERAIRSVHAGFYLSEQTVSVGLVGPGLVGRELLQQLRAQRDYLKSQLQIELEVRGIADSKYMLLCDHAIDLSTWQEQLKSDGRPLDLDWFTDHVQTSHRPHAVILDCTASADIASRYVDWLARGIHVITPNKKANAASLDHYRRLRELGDRLSTRYLYEATVGAGLPVISTLRDLVRTGDRIHQIEGVLSGTLSFLLQAFGAAQPFSAAVQEAHRRGYMEPDPRDDLSGMDVARKAVILSREMGLSVELDDVPVASLVPEELRGCKEPEKFIAALAGHDAAMEAQRLAAEQAGEVLRYVAVIEASGQVEVGLRRYPTAHVFARIQPGDNILAFTTERYHEQPLIVQGPGAGPAVTAAGVFGDLLRLAGSLGAP